MRSNLPLVSVVTPFFNTAEYLRECIESVLSQTYSNWEYILLDNCSTDGSSEIAAEFAKRESRIKLIRNVCLLPQVENYNEALRRISTQSRYTKVVEADNWIYENCLTSMVQLAEVNSTVGIVSSYSITERTVRFGGLHYSERVLTGREISRRQSLEGLYVFGSPTTVLLRSDLVRGRTPFFAEDNPYAEDLRAFYELLTICDFGFVHQITSFVRTDNESILSQRRDFDGLTLDRFILTRLFGPVFLSHNECTKTNALVRRYYYQRLARGLLVGKGRRFWKFHRGGIAAAGATPDWLYLLWQLFREIVIAILNPVQSIKCALSGLTTGAVERTVSARSPDHASDSARKSGSVQ